MKLFLKILYNLCMRDANVAMKRFLKAASSLLTGLQKPLRSQRLSKLTQVAAKNLLETIS
jgi:hypothetical protein